MSLIRRLKLISLVCVCSESKPFLCSCWTLLFLLGNNSNHPNMKQSGFDYKFIGLNLISLIAVNHDFDGSSSTGSRCFKSFKWLLQFEMVSDKRFDIQCSRGNKGQGCGVTEGNKTIIKDCFNSINLVMFCYSAPGGSACKKTKTDGAKG